MTATLQGSITVDTSTIDKAIERINKLNTQLKQITAATKAFEKAYAKGGDVAQKQIQAEKAKTEALRAELAAMKARNSEQQKSVQSFARTTKAVSSASKAILDMNQKIRFSNLDSANQAKLLSEVQQAYKLYENRVRTAAGDTAKLSLARTKLNETLGDANRTVSENTKLLSDNAKATAASNSANATTEKVLAQIESKQSKASNTVATLTQRIKKSNISVQEQDALIKDVNSALSKYQQEINDAAGNTAKITTAQTKLDKVLSGTKLTLNDYNHELDKSTKTENAKINALGVLERRLIKSQTAIKGTTLTAKEQQAQLDKLQADYNEVTAAVQKYGTANSHARKLMQDFNTTAVKRSNELRNSLKGVGRGAGQAGIQIQQFVGQIQGGVDPMIAFSQQSADLGWALGLPLAGAITGIAFSLGSAFVPALFNGKTEMEEFSDSLERLQGLAETSEDGVATISKSLITLANKNIVLARTKVQTEMEDMSEVVKKSVKAVSDSLGDLINNDVEWAEFGMSPVVIDQAEMLGNALGFVGEEASKQGKKIRDELKAINLAPTTENILSFVTTVAELDKSLGNVENEKMKELLRVSDELLALNPKFELLAKLKMTGTQEEFLALAESMLGTKEAAKSSATPLQKLITRLQTQEKALQDGSKSLQQYTIDTMEGSESEKELAKSLSMSVEKLRAKVKAEELAKKAQQSLTASITKMQEQLAIANIRNSDGEEAAFKLAYALQFGKKAFDQLDSPIQKQIQQLWDLTGAKKEAAKATRDESQALRELWAMSNQRPDMNSFSGIRDSLSNSMSGAEQAFRDALSEGANPDDAYNARLAAYEKFKSDFITSTNDLNIRLQQATQMGTMTENEALRNKYEQQRVIIEQAYKGEEALQAEHLKTLEKNYKSQNFLLQMSQSADIATGVIQGAMDGLAAYNKQGGKDYQRLALAQAAISQIVAQTKIWSEYAGNPVLAAGLSAASLAQFGGMIAQIKSQSFSTGGFVSGAGTATSDSIPARLSNGEYVVKASAVSRLGTDYLDQINSGRVPMFNSGGVVGVATNSSNQGNSWGDLTVQIVNEGNSNLEVSNTEQGLDANGQQVLKVMVREIVREEVNQGRLDSTMGRNFGLKRQPVGR